MTLISFRVDDDEAEELRRWVEALGTDRSKFLREALRRELVRVRLEADAAKAAGTPLTDEERSLERIADWGPAEDWSDWQDGAR